MSPEPANLPPKAGTIAEHRLHGTDTGSPEVQIALLTDRINEEGHEFFSRLGFFKSQMIPLRLPLAKDSATLPKA